MGKAERKRKKADVIPLYGRDEMNLIEFPFGPITAGNTKTLEVEHPVFDKALGREVTRRLIITGSDAFGLPRPVDDRVLVGMKALTYESGFASPEVHFSVYHLCRIIGWEPDGPAYRRLEASLDRIAGTTLKFRDAWWDKGEREWRSLTFHLVDEAELCSRDRYERKRLKLGKRELPLSRFVWNDVIWKSFADGYIKSLDMEMFRRIGRGRRRDVPLRLFRILDKRFHGRDVTKVDLRKLCVGTLGLSADYSPSQMVRVLDRAAKWLIECGYLRDVQYKDGGNGRSCQVVFRQATGKKHSEAATAERSAARKRPAPGTRQARDEADTEAEELAVFMATLPDDSVRAEFQKRAFETYRFREQLERAGRQVESGGGGEGRSRAVEALQAHRSAALKAFFRRIRGGEVAFPPERSSDALNTSRGRSM